MTDAPTNHGLLTDKEGTGFPGCRILVDGQEKDQPFVVLSFVQKYLDAIPKKARVCFTTKDQKISKIWEDKPAAGTTSEKSTSPEKPPAESPLSPDVRSGPQKAAGEIVTIDLQKRTVALRSIDEKGYESITGYVWRESGDINQIMQKQKQGWYVGVTYEAQGDRLVLSDCHYAERPANMKKGGGSFGGGRKGNWQPVNQKIIVAQCLEKCYTDLYLASIPAGGYVTDFKLARKTILDAVEEDIPRLMGIGGGA